jgi:hypothetical protein
MRPLRRAFALGSAALALFCFTRTATAQPFTLDEKIKPTQLTLQPYHTGDAKTDGKVYGAVITQTQESQYFFVQNISIYSPDYVAVNANDPSDRIQVSLHKETWEQASRQGRTDGGHWDAKFKTSGDFGIHVTPDRLPATYAILVWSGNEVDAPLPSPFTKSTAASVAPRSSLGIVGLYVVIALLAIALVVVSLKKSKTARMCVLIGTLAASPFVARTLHAQTYPDAVLAMLKQLKTLLEDQQTAEKFWSALDTLSSGEAKPDQGQRGPSLPSSCIDTTWGVPKQNAECACMTIAVDKLRKNRQMLEKLRILVANQKTFVDKATAVGNSYAQLHTLLGLQWVGIRKHDIEEPYAQFKIISNQKHQALMAAIEKDLKDISECEAKLGEPDWYQKFGFMYYEFLYAAYRPSF